MGFLSVLATIGKILLGIVIAIVTIIIIIFIVSLIKYKKDEENERLVRESDEGNPFSATLLKNMLEDGKITKEKINVYRERIRAEKIRQYKSTVERADAGDKYAAKELAECVKKNKLTPALVKEIRNEIAREKEEKKKREAEEKRRIEEERKKSEAYNRSVKSLIANTEDKKKLFELGMDFALKIENTTVINTIVNKTKDGVDKYIKHCYDQDEKQCHLSMKISSDHFCINEISNSVYFTDIDHERLTYEQQCAMLLVMTKKYMNYLSTHPLVKSVDDWHFDTGYGWTHYIKITLKKNSNLIQWENYNNSSNKI